MHRNMVFSAVAMALASTAAAISTLPAMDLAKSSEIDKYLSGFESPVVVTSGEVPRDVFKEIFKSRALFLISLSSGQIQNLMGCT
jgi:hypothetical protein